MLGGQGFPPPAIAALVHTTDDVPEDIILLSLEVPTVCSLPADVDKERLEEIHAQRLVSDIVRTDPKADWQLLGPGGDPPDYMVRVGQEELGLELTVFTAQDRRRGHAEFRRVRASLLDAGPLGFEHLRGHLVYFWVDTSERPGGVAQAVDRSEIVEGLRDFLPIENPLGDDPNEFFPDVMPDLGVGTADPWRYLAVPWNGPQSAAYALLGFDIGLCLESSHSATQARKELTRVITSAAHDSDGCDVLAVQVGAPDRNGLIYPTDEVIVDLAVGEMAKTPLPLRHIRRVLIHYWRRGEVVELQTSGAS